MRRLFVPLFTPLVAKLDLFLLLPLFALLLLAGVWGGVWYQLAAERQVASQETLGKSQAMAHTFGEYCQHILRQLDHASQLFKLKYEEEQGKLTLDQFARKAGGLNSALPTDTNAQWMLIDAKGQRIEANQPFAPGSVAKEGWFVSHASRPSETLVVDRPEMLAGNGQKKWQIRFSRRLNHADGRFAGVVTVEIDPTEFVDHFDSGDLGLDGVVLLHAPVEQLAIYRIGEQTRSSTQLRINPLVGADSAIEQRQITPPFDGVGRLYAARSLAEFALEAVVGLSEQVALVKYRRHRNLYLGSAVAITVLILGFTGLLMWQGRRLKQSMLQTRKNQAELTAANDASQESEARLRTIANALPAMIAYIDADERYRFHNGAYAAHFGPGIDQAMGKTVRETVGEERYAFLRPYIMRVLAGESLVYQEENWPDGVYHCLEAHYIPQFSVDGSHVVGFHVMRQDITAKKLEQIRLTKLAQIDALTGLCNRAGFQLRLADAMKHSRETQTLMALLYLDIDHFKPVNDTHGHKQGDALLKAFAQRLAHVFRGSDTVARLGGDEFIVLMENLHQAEDAKNLAARVVVAMQPAFGLEALEIQVSTSAGLAFYRGDAHSPESLMHEADMMLYQAKRNGRNQFQAAALPQSIALPPEQVENVAPLPV